MDDKEFLLRVEQIRPPARVRRFAWMADTEADLMLGCVAGHISEDEPYEVIHAEGDLLDPSFGPVNWPLVFSLSLDKFQPMADYFRGGSGEH